MGAVKRIKGQTSDPIAGGFYTVKEAARLLHISKVSKIVAWLKGYPNREVGPIIDRQYDPIEGAQELGFWDLIEVRFVEHFRKQGVSLQSLRKAAKTAREVWKQDHPFATSNVQYLTDRKEIFQSTAEELKDRVLLNLVTRQYEMYVALEEVLAKGIAFDPTTGLAREWRPFVKEFPNVLLNPLIAYGHPIVMPSRVPTDAIYKSWKAENGSYAAVAEWYEISEASAREAVEFELDLPE